MSETSLSQRIGKHHVPNRLLVRARYDAAQTTDENRKHWAAADGYDSDAANNLAVRTILRNRCRYVFANNPRAKGMINTLATHTVGTGPRLQMQLGGGTQSRKLNERIETSFRSWAKVVKLAKKLRAIRKARVHTGEIFVLLTINPLLPHDVKLDLQLIESDRITNPRPDLSSDDVDGIFFDGYGNPSSYRVLKMHPGAMFRIFGPNDYEDVSARFMLHYFDDTERAEQHRGVPEITPAVQLIEEGRRFRAAVLGAAETAADFSMAIYSDAPPNATDAEGAEDGIDAMDTFELSRRLATVLPKGWKLAQTKAEQPTTTFKEFSRELLSEVARCLQMPLSFASLDAADANMSSMYVISQPYEKAIDVERGDLAGEILDPILDAFLTLSFDPNLMPVSRRVPNEFPHTWFWPSIGQHADPGKVATAQATKLANNTTTLELEYAREGLDWESALRQRAKERELIEELGLTDASAVPPAGQTDTSGDNDDEDTED